MCVCVCVCVCNFYHDLKKKQCLTFCKTVLINSIINCDFKKNMSVKTTDYSYNQCVCVCVCVCVHMFAYLLLRERGGGTL